jgi:hypothetical protein
VESAVLDSPPATAEDEAAAARADLLALLKACPHYGYAPQLIAGRWTWSACCGSLIMNKDGKVGNSALGNWVAPSLEGVQEHYAAKYGELWKERVWPSGRYSYYPEPATLEDFLNKGVRQNCTGVVFAHMDKEKAVEIMYDEEHRKFAEGYDIDDKEQGYVCSVIWLNK